MHTWFYAWGLVPFLLTSANKFLKALCLTFFPFLVYAAFLALLIRLSLQIPFLSF